MKGLIQTSKVELLLINFKKAMMISLNKKNNSIVWLHREEKVGRSKQSTAYAAPNNLTHKHTHTISVEWI